MAVFVGTHCSIAHTHTYAGRKEERRKRGQRWERQRDSCVMYEEWTPIKQPHFLRIFAHFCAFTSLSPLLFLDPCFFSLLLIRNLELGTTETKTSSCFTSFFLPQTGHGGERTSFSSPCCVSCHVYVEISAGFFLQLHQFAHLCVFFAIRKTFALRFFCSPFFSYRYLEKKSNVCKNRMRTKNAQ